MRLLGIALPLSLLLAMALGLVLLPGIPWTALLVLACAAVPVDFATAESLLRDRRIPARARDAINVEGGYNDGIVSPVFAYALLMTGTVGDSHGSAFGSAVQAAALALLSGVVAGGLHGTLLSASERRGWTTAQSARISVVVLPVLTFAIATTLGGNGFVAAFVCGIVFRATRRRYGSASLGASADHALLEDVTALLTLAMWFVFGNVAVLVLTSGYVDLATVLYCLLVLTAVRAVPVLVALARSRPDRTERLLIAFLGPRGTTSIVFGLLAFNQLADAELGYTVLGVTSLVVLGSVLVHGLAAAPLARRVGRARRGTIET